MKVWSVMLLAVVGVYAADRSMSPCGNQGSTQATLASGETCAFSAQASSCGAEAAACASEEVDCESSASDEVAGDLCCETVVAEKSLSCCDSYASVKRLATAAPAVEHPLADEAPAAKIGDE